LIALLLAAANASGDQSTSANYSIATSIDGGGQLVASGNYAMNVIVTPISGRAVATFSDVMVVGFATRLNNPPIAVNDVLSHPLNFSVQITPSSLFANDSDPDNDLLSLVSVDSISDAGGSISVVNQVITYVPPQGLAGTDQFNYIVADSNGDVASATVLMLIAPPITDQPINTVALTEQADGKFLLRFRSQTGLTEYVIQYSNDLNNPNWQTLEDVRAGADGFVQALVDPALAKDTFFRAVAF